MTRRRGSLRAVLLAGGLLASTSLAHAQTAVTGAGSTFGGPLYKQWATSVFANAAIGSFTYDAAGSGEGIARFQRGAVDLGASDVPMSDAQLGNVKGGGGDVLQIPTAFGAIVLTYNLPNYPGKLYLTGDQIAKIYLGEITYWDDPRLWNDHINTGLKGRHFQIIAVHRAESSGTTYGFTTFLSESNEVWKDRDGLGAGFSVYWPIGDERYADDLVATVQKNPYSIGYTELGFALKRSLPVASIANGAGQYVDPTIASVQAAVASAGAAASGSDLRLRLIDAAAGYPITTGTYLIVHRHQSDPGKVKALSLFLRYAIHQGQEIEPGLFYAPLPPSVVTLIDHQIDTIGTN
jgi:phosphate transport system substrate-binding protein